MPWTGGLNDSVDSGLIPDNDLVQADNVTFGVSGSRLKREGINYFDQLTIPAASTVTKSGTTITINFASDIVTATNKIFVVGEKLNIQCTDAEYTNATATVTAIPNNDEISYTVGVEPTAASATLTSITRTASIVGLHDFWYYNASNNAKSQYILAVNSDAQVFKYAVNGERTQLSNKTYSVTFVAATERVTETAHGLVVGDAVAFTVVTTTTSLLVGTTYYVASVVDADNYTLASTRTGAGPEPIDNNGTGTRVSPLYTTSINSASFLSMNEKCLITFDGIGNFPKVFDPVTSLTEIRGAKGACPNAKFVCEKMHNGAAWINDKTENERLHYSATYDFDKWNGYDDSGVLNIGYGDGDPDGINAIYPPFKGTLFITKRNSIYRVDGVSAESYQINAISSSAGVGGVGHQAVASVDLDDVLYMSYKGTHSLAAVAAYGDFNSTFTSEKIQNAFKEWTSNRLKFTSAKYIPTLNSVFWSVASGNYDDDNQDVLYVYNTKFKEWHTWPNIQAKSLGSFDDSGTQKLLMGRYDGRIDEAQIGDYVDHTTSAIQYTVKSGTIYVDGNPNTMKAYKKLGFIFRPKGDYTFTATVKIDNFSQQAIAFSQVSGGARLGEDFILGESLLASANVLAPHMLPIDGIGRGLTIKIDNNGSNQQVEIYGLVIEWENAGDAQENIGTGDL